MLRLEIITIFKVKSLYIKEVFLRPESQKLKLFAINSS